MLLTVEAVYENGVLKPFTALNLAEHQHVMVQVITPVESHEKPNPTAVTFQGAWSTELGDTELGDEANAAIAALHAQTVAKLKRLTSSQLPPPASISMKGIWSHISPDELEQALVDVRLETNRRLQRLADAL